MFFNWQNEDSPTSSKGSSPDMEEYEVINKGELIPQWLRNLFLKNGRKPCCTKQDKCIRILL